MAESKTGGKKLILNSMIYSLSGLLIKCFSFFLLPIYTAYLSTEDYGITNISSSFLHTMSFIVTFSLFSAVMRFYVDLKDDAEKLKRFYGTIILFTCASGGIWTILLILFRNVISNLIFSGVDFFPVIFVSVISLIFSCLHTIYDNILKSQQKAAKSSILSFIYFIVTVSLNIFFVAVLRLGARGVVLATLISGVIYTIYFVFDIMVSRSVRWCIDLPLLKVSLKYSIPIIPHNLSTQIAILISQALIGGTASLGAVGVYAIASQFGNIADTVQSYVNQAYGPWLYEKLHEKQEDYKLAIRSLVRMLVMVIVFLLLGITLFAEDYILGFLNSSYSEACKYVPWVILVYALKIPYYFYINVLFYFKKAARFIFIATLSGSLINILLSALLIPGFGIYGSIAADLICMLIRVAIVVIISLKFENIGIKLRDFVFGILVFIFFAFIAIAPSLLNFSGEFSLYRFLYKGMIICVYLALLLLIYRKKITMFLKNRKEMNK